MAPDPETARALAWFRTGDTGRALRELEALVEKRPSSVSVHNALGSVLGALRLWDRAAVAFERALELSPEHPEAATNLGTLLLERGRILDALKAFERAIRSGRAPVPAFAGQGRALLLLGRSSEATRAFERAGDHPHADAIIHSQRCYAALFDPELDALEVAAVHRDFERKLTAGRAPAVRIRRRANVGGRRTVGYLSADFRQHSVASFLEGVLRAHDRSEFRVIAYSDVLQEDATTAALEGLVDGFERTARLSNQALLKQIRADQVDVLVDLSGHMQRNRLPLFAEHAAPIELTYLGYPGSTGLSAFAGRITDGWADPSDDAAIAGPEPLCRVDGGCFAYTPPGDAPDVAPPPSATSAGVTFGSMNDTLKVNELVLATWAEILRALPESRLLIKARLAASPEVRDRIVRSFGRHGIAGDRVDICAWAPSRREHLAAYARVDLALDTFPYNGATTTCEALYMGVPVITFAGDRHAARMGTSIASAAGLAELVAPTREAYVRLALDWARAPERRAELRKSLRDRLQRSPLFDGSRIARAIEDVATTLESART